MLQVVGHKIRQEEVDPIIERHTKKVAAKVAARKKKLATKIKSLEQPLATQVEASKNREVERGKKNKLLEQQYEKTDVELKRNPTDVATSEKELARKIKSLEQQHVESKRSQHKVTETEGRIEEARREKELARKIEPLVQQYEQVTMCVCARACFEGEI